MKELLRTALSKKMLLLTLLMVFINCVFFSYECDTEKQITLTGDELNSYIESYPDYLQSVFDNAENMGAISLLQGKDSFAVKNIDKTVLDYSVLSGKVQYGENRAVVAYSNYMTGDFMLMAVIVLIAMRFSEEKRKGVLGIVKTAVKGRRILALQRIGIIFGSAFAIAFLFTLTEMLTAGVMLGDMELSRSIQSVPEFKMCSLPIDISGYLIISTAIKALTVSVIGLFIYFFTYILSITPASLIAAIIFGTEYILHAFIIPTDRFNFFKFANIFTGLKNDVFFKNYCNLNIFGAPIGFMEICIVLLILLAVLFSVLCIFITSGNMALSLRGFGILSGAKEKIAAKLPTMPLFLWETKKILINQKGIVIVIAAAFLAISSVTQYSYYTYTDYNRQQMYEKFKGPVNEKMIERLENDIESYKKGIENIDKKLAETDPDNESKIYELTMQRINLQSMLTLSEEFHELGTDRLEYRNKTGIPVHIIDNKPYKLLLISDTATINKNSLYILIALIICFSGVIAYERQCNMYDIQRSQRRGRGLLILSKLILVFIISVLLSASVNIAHLINFTSSVELKNLTVPCQSLTFLDGIPWLKVNILEYLIITYTLRILAAFAVGLLVSLISRLSKSSSMAMGVSAGVILIPTILKSAGVSFMISFADFVSLVLK
ncbi:MAG: hypothetical protein IKT78_01735 [Ruminiclostridium sp.]|nr:hypothetical protein [Ruminiclostridium sp.]